MVELKTLKDLECIHLCDNRSQKYCDACGEEEYHSLDEHDLKQELAIEWIKKLQHSEDEGLNFPIDKKCELHKEELWAVRKWIKHVFNISEKDLK